MSKTAWIIFAVVCVIVLGGLIFLSTKDRINVDKVDVSAVQPAVKESGDIADHVFGKSDSPVKLIEYGDYQCPGCGNAYPNLKAVSEKYKDQLAFVFRNFPLTTIHPNARAAAAAAEAAGLQNKFWEMHNILYENQSSWENLDAGKRVDYFAQQANQLGLNVDGFKKDMGAATVNQKINFDQAVGKKATVNATPTIFLNGKSLGQDVWTDPKKLDEVVANELKAHNIQLPQS